MHAAHILASDCRVTSSLAMSKGCGFLEGNSADDISSFKGNAGDHSRGRAASNFIQWAGSFRNKYRDRAEGSRQLGKPDPVRSQNPLRRVFCRLLHSVKVRSF